MDANGLRFWLLADEAHWQLRDGAAYDRAARRLRLRSERDRPLPADLNAAGAEGEALGALGRVPQARDAYGTRAVWDSARGVVVATGAVPGAVRAWEPAPGEVPTDLAVGYDGVLYVALGDQVVLHDLRDRWPDARVAAAGFEAWRLAADPEGGAWVLDRAGARLAHVHGQPLPWGGAPAGNCTPRPCDENPDPPALVVLTRARWTGLRAVAVAAAPNGRVAVLAWRPAAFAELWLASDDGTFAPRARLDRVRFPYALAWTGDDAVAVRASRLPGEALVYELADVLADALGTGVGAGDAAPALAPALQPAGGAWPLRDPVAGPFAHGVLLPPHYPTRPRPDDAPAPEGSAPLHRLTPPTYAPRGQADGRRPMDSGSTGTVWHRLYVEARVPAGCGMRLFLAASDEAVAPADAADWHEHRVGDAAAFGGGREPVPYAVPRAAWLRAPSELPFHDGMLGDCPREPGRGGLFTVLVQRANRPVRALRGRYLWARVELLGDRRGTPELAAVRAYGSRFSYVERYLPALYHEALPEADGDPLLPNGLPSTPADFLERFVDNFEGVLTPLEDRIAESWLLTDPRSVPEASLDWLGGWIGVAFDAAYPAVRRRRLLAETPRLYRERGTLAGLRRALDVATDGGCADGRLVVLEHWRLRRTFATILGADLADEQDPLLAGIATSGNSFVGDTLFVGDAPGSELDALFRASDPPNAGDEAAVLAFFDRMAYRVTVLVHQEVTPTDLGLVRRVVALETPAHVACDVVLASAPFLVSVAALVGVDTYLAPPERPRSVDLDRSALGVRDLLFGPASLDPRLASTAARVVAGDARPTAVLRGPAAAPFAESFALDARESRAAPGRQLVRFRWQLLA